MPVQTVIQLRTSPAATWTSVNPTLAVGEVGFESDTNKLKIGNGTSTWTLLDYSSGGGVATVVSPTAPTEDLVEGMMWFNSTEAKTYIYYSSAWVELSPAIAGPEGPEGPPGPSGVIAVTSPITNSGTSTSATIGIDQTAIAINASQVATTSTDKSANYTLIAGDKNSYIRSTNSAITITVPDVLADGQSVNFIQAGTGQITFAGSGITLNSAEAKLKTARQFAAATIVKLAGAYYLVGNLA